MILYSRLLKQIGIKNMLKDSIEICSSIPWEGCNHTWVYTYLYHPVLKCHFPYYRQCSRCQAQEFKSVAEFTDLRGNLNGWLEVL
jgi:hypothetical protein